MRVFKHIFWEIWSDLKRIREKGSFVQNLTLISSSKSVVFVVGFLFTPILTRVYGPEAYGLFAQFNAYLVVLSSLMTLGLNTALVVPKSEKEFIGLSQIILLTTLVVTGLFCLFLVVNSIFKWVLIVDSSYYDFLLIPALALSGLLVVLNGWNIRKKNFRKASFLSTINVFSSKVFSLTFGVVTGGNTLGIILAHILDLAIKCIGNNFILGWNRIKRLFISIESFKVLKSYAKYPISVLPSQWISIWIGQLPVLFLGPYFGAVLIGQYGLSNSILYIPIQLIGQGAMGPLLLQKSIELREQGGNFFAERIFKIQVALIVSSVFVFSVMYHFSEGMFTFFFGDEWVDAGRIASILSIFFAFDLISVPSSSIMRVLRMEEYSLYLSISRLVLCSLGIFLGIYYDSFYVSIWLIAIGNSAVRIFAFYFFGYLANLDLLKITLIFLFCLLVYNGILIGLKLLL